MVENKARNSPSRLARSEKREVAILGIESVTTCTGDYMQLAVDKRRGKYDCNIYWQK